MRSPFTAIRSVLAIPSPSAPLAVAPIEFTDRTLPNGLRVLLVEDHRVPSVAINVGYRVGGKDDPPGRAGFAHLFEHLMFKGTKNTRPETIDRLTEDIGGQNNAFTADDITNYYEIVPSNYLETLLWAEADRMGSLAVTEEHFHTERDVVIGEYDQRILAEPYGMLDELLNATAYNVHPYKRGVIGDPDNLRAAGLDDVVAFHRTFYRPDNAVLVVAGDLDPEQTNAWIDRYFGRIPRPPAPIPRVTTMEPPQREERRASYSAANVPLPALAYAWHIPAWRHPDSGALDVLETLLGMGKSSRLYQSLVYRSRVATNAYALADLREQPGLFIVRAIASSGTSFGDLRAAVDAELARLAETPPSDDEMDRVRVQIASSLVRSRQTYNSLAIALVRSAVERDDPAALNSDLERYLAVSADDVQRVARAYLTPENRTTVTYLPE